MTSFPRLTDYAFVADGERGILVDSAGGFGWMCFPGWGDEALFAGLLGSGGIYRIQPTSRFISGGSYEDGTLIWRHNWITEHGIVRCRDALVYPGDPSRAVVIRRVTAVDMPARVCIELDPARDYGRRPLRWSTSEGSTPSWEACEGGIWMSWSGPPIESVKDGPSGLRAHLELGAGESRDLVLEIGAGSVIDACRSSPDSLWRKTESNWKAATGSVADTAAPRDAKRSVALLIGMTTGQGSTVAAATTSLPEQAEGERNYDYRYTWIRDTCYAGQCGASVPGAEALLDSSVGWVAARLLEDGPEMAPAYRTDGSPIPEPHDLDLPGYPGGGKLVGNRVRNQFQLDIFGESLLLLARAADVGRLDCDGYKAAEVAVRVLEKGWTEPDAGIWETEPDIWAHGRLIAVAGLKAIAANARQHPWATEAERLAAVILEHTSSTSTHPSGRWQRSPKDERVDAALLLSEIRNALPPQDPRSEATRRAVQEELSFDGYIYRYRHRGSDLGETEGAFLICGFWMSLACCGAGDLLGAARWFERARSAANPAGLFAEEFNVQSHQLGGNVPQAFVHALLAEASAALYAADPQAL